MKSEISLAFLNRYISSDFGLGSGEDRLKAALDDNFDDITTLFGDDENGIAERLFDFADQFTKSSGLISTREKAAREEKSDISDDRDRLEIRMASFEKTLRDRYTSLDQTITKLNQTGSALFAALNQ